eukprot:m.138697 g.138697  ORF g.138697 m.138697 type:complete len:982 (-) comp14780_c0_seq5:948-3893(-)
MASIANLEHENDDDGEDLLLGGDAENQKLTDEIKALENELLDVEGALEENSNRNEAMEQHLNNVLQEAASTKKLVDTRRKDMQNQKEKLMSDKREKSRLNEEISKIQKLNQDTKDRMSSKQNLIFKKQKKIEQIKDQMKWEQKKMEKWLADAQKREEDAEAIMKYTRADEGRIKECNLEIEDLTKQVNRLQVLLDKEVIETHSHEMGLDKNALLFNQAHGEYRKLVQQWEETLAKMQSRDQDIQAEAEKFQAIKLEVANRSKELQEEENLLKEELSANQEVETKISLRERQVQQAQNHKLTLEEELARFETELDALKNSLSTTTAAERGKRAEVKQLRVTISKLEEKIEAMNGAIELAEEGISVAQTKTMSAEQQAKALEKQLNTEEARLESVIKSLEMVQSHVAKEAQRLHELKREEQLIHSEIKSSMAMLSNLGSQIRILDKRKLEEETLIYKQEFEIALLERKLAKLKGVDKEDKSKEIEEKKRKLLATLESHKKDKVILRQQLRKLEDELRTGRKKEEREVAQLTKQNDKLDELMLEIKRAEEDLSNLTSQKQDQMVNENILKLELRRRRKQLNRRADEVMTLEQQQVYLKSSMDERFEEIQIHKDILEAQLRTAKDQRSAITRDLKERSVKIDQLRKRHEIVVMTSAPADPSGERKSQAFLLVQAAHEREELQNRGDELDEKIRKGEKEIRQLERVLQKMANKNSQFRKSISSVHENDDEAQEKEALETRLGTIMDGFRHRRRERNEIHHHVDNMRIEVHNIEAQLHEVQHQLDTIKAKKTQLETNMIDQEGKLDRAMNSARQAVKTYRKQEEVKFTGGETSVEIDFRVRQTKEFNKKVLYNLENLVTKHPQIHTEVNMLFERAGFEPTGSHRRPQTGLSSRSSSRASSRASTASIRSTASRRRCFLLKAYIFRFITLELNYTLIILELRRTKPSSSEAAIAAKREGLVTHSQVSFNHFLSCLLFHQLAFVLQTGR